MIKKILLTTLFLIVLAFVIGWVYFSRINNYQLKGQITFSELTKPVTVHRDKYGIPYIFAENTPDLIRSQGFITAQDRVFQVELYRKLIKGELSSVLGEMTLNSDIRMRVVGIQANAKRQVQFLDDENKAFLTWYAEGYNAFIKNRKHEFPIELKLLGLQPTLISIEDLLAIQHYIGFSHSQNYEDEILGLNLAKALGTKKALELLPLNINPDRKQPISPASLAVPTSEKLIGELPRFQKNTPFIPMSLPTCGSNNWVTTGKKSATNLPILSNDPHLDAQILPGPWFPIGLFTPEISAVGGTPPAMPGILNGRTRHVAFGITNSYGDSQDLYLEQVDSNKANHYIDNGQSVPFEKREITIRVKDENTKEGYRMEVILVRYTKRGPVISDHAVFGLSRAQPVVLRWALAELTSGTLGIPHFLNAKNIMEMDSLIATIDLIYLNFVFADTQGGIGHRASGLIPIRQHGATAKVPSATDDWTGFIPKNEMPGQINPPKGWLGTSNHDVVPDSFPYYYSAHFSSYYRYERAKEVLSSAEKLTVEEHWNLILDTKNKHAERFTPIFVKALSKDAATQSLADQLAAWDFKDAKESVGATIFHLLHENLVRLMLADDIPADLFDKYLNARYYWLQRIDDIIAKGTSNWFDIQGTKKKETLEDLIIEAGKQTQNTLTQKLGKNNEKWTWGRLHTIHFRSPLRQQGIGKNWLGTGTYPIGGSGETLNRGDYALGGDSYESQWFSSMRLIADMSDNEKIRAVISGGNAARQFHPYFKAQVKTWLSEKWIPWWLDKAKVEENSVYQLEFLPE